MPWRTCFIPSALLPACASCFPSWSCTTSRTGSRKPDCFLASSRCVAHLEPPRERRLGAFKLPPLSGGGEELCAGHGHRPGGVSDSASRVFALLPLEHCGALKVQRVCLFLRLFYWEETALLSYIILNIEYSENATHIPSVFHNKPVTINQIQSR